ncbi:hypothetical protein ABEX44_23030 [Priestia megaterium]
MKTEIDVFSFFQKIMKQFEEKHGKMTFSFKKKNEDFIITDINDSFLSILEVQKGEVVGKIVSDNISWIGNDLDIKLGEIYSLAWSGKTVVFYCTFTINKSNILLITTLTPILSNNKVHEVLGSCVPLNKEKFNKEFIILKSLKPFIILKE